MENFKNFLLLVAKHQLKNKVNEKEKIFINLIENLKEIDENFEAQKTYF